MPWGAPPAPLPYYGARQAAPAGSRSLGQQLGLACASAAPPPLGGSQVPGNPQLLQPRAAGMAGLGFFPSQQQQQQPLGGAPGWGGQSAAGHLIHPGDKINMGLILK